MKGIDKNESSRVTELELKVLQHLWASDDGLTVNDIVDSWSEAKKPGYTTVLKTLQNMEKREIVGHRPHGRKYVYFAVISKDVVTKSRLGRIIEGMFGGNKLSFVEHFVKNSDLSGEELQQLKDLITQKEKEEKEK